MWRFDTGLTILLSTSIAGEPLALSLVAIWSPPLVQSPTRQPYTDPFFGWLRLLASPARWFTAFGPGSLNSLVRQPLGLFLHLRRGDHIAQSTTHSSQPSPSACSSSVFFLPGRESERVPARGLLDPSFDSTESSSLSPN